MLKLLLGIFFNTTYKILLADKYHWSRPHSEKQISDSQNW